MASFQPAQPHSEREPTIVDPFDPYSPFKSLIFYYNSSLLAFYLGIISITGIKVI